MAAGLVLTMAGGCSTQTPSTTATVDATFTMPDLTGMYWMDAEPSLRELGWTGTLNKKPDVGGAPAYRIATQDPAPGAAVPGNAVISLGFGAD